MSEQQPDGQWPAYGIWGAMPGVGKAEYELDEYHLHRWLDATAPDAPFEEIFFLEAEQEAVKMVADYLNALESQLAEARAEIARIKGERDKLQRLLDHNVSERLKERDRAIAAEAQAARGALADRVAAMAGSDEPDDLWGPAEWADWLDDWRALATPDAGKETNAHS